MFQSHELLFPLYVKVEAVYKKNNPIRRERTKLFKKSHPLNKAIFYEIQMYKPCLSYLYYFHDWILIDQVTSIIRFPVNYL